MAIDAGIAPMFVPADKLHDTPATYRELCTLAGDMKQPELVYKFMQLAGNQALWNEKAVGGLSCVPFMCARVYRAPP
jgi:hypothetical protein